ncbi:MAG: hypothetical protein ACLR7U_05700 [Ruthenibacterium lactatiformans]
MLAACLTVQGSHPGVFGGEALILPLMGLLLYVATRPGACRAGAGGTAGAEHGKEET